MLLIITVSYYRGVKKVCDMKIALHIVRHGETENNVRKIINGQHDSPLVETGIRDSKLSGEFLRAIDFNKVYVSDLGRCIGTLKHMGIPGKPISGLRDRNFGEYNGKPYQLYHDAKMIYRRMNKDAEGPHPVFDELELPGVEHYQDLYNRIRQVIDKTVMEIVESSHDRHELAHVLYVTHCSPVRMCAMYLEQYSSLKYNGNLRYCSVPNNSITEFHITADNVTGHISSVDIVKLFSVMHLRDKV